MVDTTVTVLNNIVIDSSNPGQDSVAVDCSGYRRFALFLTVESDGAPTDLRVQIAQRNPITGIYHFMREGIWAAFYYEDVDTASPVNEMFEGQVWGDRIRVRVDGTGLSAVNLFKVTASIGLIH